MVGLALGSSPPFEFDVKPPMKENNTRHKQDKNKNNE